MSEKHHSHEISDHPEIQWALELLKPDPNYEPSIMTKYSTEVIFVGIGFAIPSCKNMFNKKPFYAGKCQHGFLSSPRSGIISLLGLLADLTSRRVM